MNTYASRSTLGFRASGAVAVPALSPSYLLFIKVRMNQALGSISILVLDIYNYYGKKLDGPAEIERARNGRCEHKSRHYWTRANFR